MIFTKYQWKLVAVWLPAAILGFLMSKIANASTVQQWVVPYFDIGWISLFAVMIVTFGLFVRSTMTGKDSESSKQTVVENPHPYHDIDNDEENDL